MIDTKTQILHLASEIKNCNQAIRRQKESIAILKTNMKRLIENLTPDEKKLVLREWRKINDLYPSDDDLRLKRYDKKYQAEMNEGR